MAESLLIGAMAQEQKNNLEVRFESFPKLVRKWEWLFSVFFLGGVLRTVTSMHVATAPQATDSTTVRAAGGFES